jgi:hypothetical protein
MKIHYFQRYHQKENVETANTMLLLNRLYTYSPNKFYRLIKNFLPQNAEIEMELELQKKTKNSVPDAVISQPSFKIVVETKLNGNFDIPQLIGHLDAFENEKYKVLLTLDPKPMKEQIRNKLQNVLYKYNEDNNTNISHFNTTFEEILKNIEAIIDERDYDMQDILQDYSEYCYSEGLIPDSWKRMRVQLAGTTLDINKKLNLYYDIIDRNFSEHDYLGLYNQKSVRAVGKITAIILNKFENGEWIYVPEKGALTDDIKNKIVEAREDAKKYGYDMTNSRYFVVDEFYETDFKKETPYAPMGSRMFDLTEVLGTDKLPSTKDLADQLRKKTWR